MFSFFYGVHLIGLKQLHGCGFRPDPSVFPPSPHNSGLRVSGPWGSSNAELIFCDVVSGWHRLACFEGTSIYYSYGVVKTKQAAAGERLGQRPAILGRYLWKGGVFLMKVEQLMRSGCHSIVRAIQEGTCSEKSILPGKYQHKPGCPNLLPGTGEC